MTVIERTATRIRHESRLRLLQVRDVQPITPHMVQITLGGDELAGFVSGAHDDHVKLFLPQPGEDQPRLPDLGPAGRVFAEGAPRPIARDYTPRRYDAAAGTLVIEFALHGDGPAARWAAQARPGQSIGVGGPRGSFVVPDDFAWYLLAGDDTALPAISRRLEELPAGPRALVVVEVADAAEERRFTSRADVEVRWLHRDGAAPGTTSLLATAISALTLPRGEGYAWIAAESATAKVLRRHLVDERGVRKDRVRAAAYWRRGAAAVHETFTE